MIPLFARTVRGLEDMAAKEISALPGTVVSAPEHRTVRFEMAELTPALASLGLVDDVFLDLGVWDGLDHRRAALALVADIAEGLDPRPALGEVAALRGQTLPGAFDVVASFLGHRNYNRFDIEDALGAALALRGMGTYLPRRGGAVASTLTLRAHMEEDRLSLGLRLFAQPLHRRDFRPASRQGALHAPAARALALLAGVRQGVALLDQCCNTGTILLEAEAALPGLPLIGGDIDAEGLAAGRANAAAAGIPVAWFQADAGSLPFASHSIERIATNIPWGLTVAPMGLLAHRPEAFWQELGRVLGTEGRASVLVAEAPSATTLAEAHLNELSSLKIALSGTWSTALVVSPSAAKD